GLPYLILVYKRTAIIETTMICTALINNDDTRLLMPDETNLTRDNALKLQNAEMKRTATNDITLDVEPVSYEVYLTSESQTPVSAYTDIIAVNVNVK
ncbi:hypothetical protein ACS6GF_11945, partial [Enterobacter cloacae]|uniref:hypothetical protein n=1 Tax=Enterobacter cloacae TaxID=550 RepID=UPI003F42AC10